MIRRLLNWWRTFDRCRVDGKRIAAHDGYTMCRKHAGPEQWSTR